jgi:hypothetical protein
VAGLQFEVVYLIHADQSDLSDELLSQGARRRYVNRVYLGASRAQRLLVVASSRERGGRSEILEAPLENRSLAAVEDLQTVADLQVTQSGRAAVT